MLKLSTILTVFLSFALQAQGDVTITGIEESRGSLPSLRVLMQFHKKDLIAGHKYEVQIKSAIDSTGKKLSYRGPIGGPKFKEGLLTLDLLFDLPQRSAKTFSVEGELMVKTVDEDIIYVKKAPTLLNKKVEHKVLTEAGVSVIVNNNDRELTAKVSGNPKAIGSVNLVNKDGVGIPTRTSKGVTFYSFFTKGKGIGKDAMLKIIVHSNEKEVEKLPFKFVNHPLP